MLFSVGSLHDKSRRQAWCMGPTTSFSRHASHFKKSYVLFVSSDYFFFLSSSGTFFLKRPAYYAAYLPNVYASLRLLTFFQDKEDSALLTLPLLRDHSSTLKAQQLTGCLQVVGWLRIRSKKQLSFRFALAAAFFHNRAGNNGWHRSQSLARKEMLLLDVTVLGRHDPSLWNNRGH